MKLFVLFGQRQERYAGQFGIEALDCQTEYEVDDNPELLHKKKEWHQTHGDFAALEIVELDVDEKAVEAILSPAHQAITAKVKANG